MALVIWSTEKVIVLKKQSSIFPARESMLRWRWLN